MSHSIFFYMLFFHQTSQSYNVGQYVETLLYGKGGTGYLFRGMVSRPFYCIIPSFIFYQVVIISYYSVRLHAIILYDGNVNSFLCFSLLWYVQQWCISSMNVLLLFPQIEHVYDTEVRVRFMKTAGGDSYIWPAIDDLSDVPMKDVVKLLPCPSLISRGRYKF